MKNDKLNNNSSQDSDENQTDSTALGSPTCCESSFYEVWRVQGVDTAENIVVDMSLNKKFSNRPDVLARIKMRICDQIEDAGCEISNLTFTIKSDVLCRNPKRE